MYNSLAVNHLNTPTEIKCNSRKQWIDALRAVAMLFVILGHQVEYNTFFIFTCPIKLPLFFMITGYVFNNERTAAAFFKNLAIKLIFPWLCLTIPLYVLYTPFKGIEYLLDCVLQTISGELYWYMPCCILAEIIWFFTHKIAVRKTKYICVASLVLSLIGIIFSNYNILDFAMLNRAMLAQSWILMGYLYRINKDKIDKLKWGILILLLIIYIVMGCISIVIWPECSIDVRMNIWYNYPYCFSMILVGCFAVFAVAEKNYRFPAWLVFIGQNTLVYYILHQRIIAIFMKCMSLIHINIPLPLIKAVVKTCVGCICCGIVAVLLNRYIPEAVGKKRISPKNSSE